jgi:hypothetical protein
VSAGLSVEDIARLRREFEKTTPGTWAKDDRPNRSKDITIVQMKDDWPQDPVCWVGFNQARREADADFIASAHNAFAELLDLAAVGAAVRSQEARREAHKRNCPHCGVANPKYRDGACQACGEPGK